MGMGWRNRGDRGGCSVRATSPLPAASPPPAASLPPADIVPNPLLLSAALRRGTVRQALPRLRLLVQARPARAQAGPCASGPAPRDPLGRELKRVRPGPRDSEQRHLPPTSRASSSPMPRATRRPAARRRKVPALPLPRGRTSVCGGWRERRPRWGRLRSPPRSTDRLRRSVRRPARPDLPRRRRRRRRLLSFGALRRLREEADEPTFMTCAGSSRRACWRWRQSKGASWNKPRKQEQWRRGDPRDLVRKFCLLESCLLIHGCRKNQLHEGMTA
jgi:hypothetical protein